MCPALCYGMAKGNHCFGRIKQSRKYPKLLNVLSWVGKEVKTQLYLIVPLALSYFFLDIPFFVAIAFAGHMKSNTASTMAAISLSVTINYVIICAVTFGLVTALETLVSQAYGAGNLLRVGTANERNSFHPFKQSLLHPPHVLMFSFRTLPNISIAIS